MELVDKLVILRDGEYINNANYKTFASALNKAMKEYDISTCIRKIHFLAQCYHETQRFTLTYEENPRNISGGNFYRGRGLIQLSHDYNYKKYYKKINAKDPDSEELNSFVPRVAKEIDLACDASGYYWKNIGAGKGDLNPFADKDSVGDVSQGVNGWVGEKNVVGIDDRKKMTILLKEIMNYEYCNNRHGRTE